MLELWTLCLKCALDYHACLFPLSLFSSSLFTKTPPSFSPRTSGTKLPVKYLSFQHAIVAVDRRNSSDPHMHNSTGRKRCWD